MGMGATAIPVPLKTAVAVETRCHWRTYLVWGLHPTIAQEVNMKNPRMLNRAMEPAKRADVAITMSKRPG